MRESIVRYCSRLGGDPLLVQGAGGNVSWKEGDTLWVKASGTWLAHAGQEEIFVPVDLVHLRGALSLGDFSVRPRVRGESSLRPSIETLLHALMPQRVVVHLHPVEVVARLVRSTCGAELEDLFGSSLPWTLVGYHKPGAALAAAVRAALVEVPGAAVVFLRNHGLVVGGKDVEEVDALLEVIISTVTGTCAALAGAAHGDTEGKMPEPLLAPDGRCYLPVDGAGIQNLSHPLFFDRLERDWALCPDHVVFLGGRPACYPSLDDVLEDIERGNDSELFFVKGEGVYSAPTLSAAQRVQLQCFYDVLARQSPDSPLHTLDCYQVAELLAWDAERYRQQLARGEGGTV
ncbi:class II aldolase/adducin family protein [Geomonas sp. RF6]|uniref:class II aldolase/adducin family protein n=1 Tax=Geomonas sp. RF6 TaxID=2897342 RepID=UPI001E330693|nr:class II aldolase/adducin family protein [Geomonas sp. RF6]UFS69736.1 class II aldolase/adducin family protein [Geomonas sp. RF6]